MKQTFKQLFCSIVLICCALPAYAANPVPQVKEYVEKLVQDVSTMLADEKITAEEKVIRSKDLLSKNLDLEWMAKYSLGRHRKTLTKAQIDKFVDVYSRYVVKYYSEMVKNYKGQKGIVKKIDSIDKDEFSVLMNIKKPGQAPMTVNFMVRAKNEGNKVVLKVADIITEGMSSIDTQRNDFDDKLTTGSFDEVLEDLKKKS